VAKALAVNEDADSKGKEIEAQIKARLQITSPEATLKTETDPFKGVIVIEAEVAEF
jgi:hypothetical protein